jgi:branched-chain amino acid transport system ATP-binding protein
MFLETKALNAGYGSTQVLFDVNMRVKEKDITVVVGPNGSGKSTLIKTIMGITKVFSGEVLFNGQNIAGLPPHTVTKLGIAYLPQVSNVFAELKVKENLRMAAYILTRDQVQERIPEALESYPVLKDAMNKKAGTLSGGQRQMLAMAMAIIRRPQIMLFDEPTGSLAPKVALEVLDRIVALRDTHHITVVLIEQNAKRALEHGDTALLLVSGRVQYEGGASDLLNHRDLGRLYLGIQDL